MKKNRFSKKSMGISENQPTATKRKEIAEHDAPPEGCHALLAVRDVTFRGIYCFPDSNTLSFAEGLLRESFLRNYKIFQNPEMKSVQRLAASFAGIHCFLPPEELKKDIARHQELLRGEGTHPFFLCLARFRGMGFPTVRVIAGNRSFLLFLDDMFFYRLNPSYSIEDLVLPNPVPDMHPPVLTVFEHPKSRSVSISVVEFYHMARRRYEELRKTYGDGLREFSFSDYVCHYASGSPAYKEGFAPFGRIRRSSLDSSTGGFLFLSSVTNRFDEVSEGEIISMQPVKDESSPMIAINLDDVRDITACEVPGLIYDMDFRRSLTLYANLVV